jgi:hypothetical protein
MANVLAKHDDGVVAAVETWDAGDGLCEDVLEDGARFGECYESSVAEAVTFYPF